MEIEEGSEYFFTVEKIINLAGTEYFVLLAEFDKKYLIPAINYIEYKIKTGDKIKCKVDKINCNGKVFLEPDCPIYSVGDNDVFTLQEKEERITHKTYNEYMVIKAVSNKTNRGIVLIAEKLQQCLQGEKWLCEIQRIKKGEMYLKPILKV